MILINQEVIGAEFEHQQTSEQLQRVFAPVGFLCLVKVHGDAIRGGEASAVAAGGGGGSDCRSSSGAKSPAGPDEALVEEVQPGPGQRRRHRVDLEHGVSQQSISCCGEKSTDASGGVCGGCTSR